MSKNIPEIRINGFDNSWEERKFKETVMIERGGSPRPIDDFITESDEGLNWIKIGDAPKRGNIITKTKEKIRPEGLAKTREVHQGDLILSNSMSFGKPYIMGISGCIHDGWLLIRNEKNVYNLQFLCHLLGTEQMIQQYRSLAAGSTVSNLNKDLVSNTVVKFPTIIEQEYIGEYFDAIEDIITLQQQEYEKLVNNKKAMLEKMFPKEGYDVPEIRFKGFDEPWRKHRLVETAKYRNGKAHENCIDENGKYIVVNSKFVSTNGEIRKFSNMQNEPLYKNEIAFVLSDVPNGRAIARTFLVDESGKYTLNQRIAGITPLDNTYPYFLHILMNRHPYFLAFDDGAKQTNLTVQDVLDFEAFYPEYEEQKKIGEYFAKFDELIMNHQQELEKLKNIKAALLEKMFV